MRPGKIGVAFRDIARDQHTVFESSLRRNGAFDDNRNSSAASNDGQSTLRQREKQRFGLGVTDGVRTMQRGKSNYLRTYVRTCTYVRTVGGVAVEYVRTYVCTYVRNFQEQNQRTYVREVRTYVRT